VVPESVRKFSPADLMDTFDCGQPTLNQFLQRYSLNNQQYNSAQTYVSCQRGEVVGFYSLAAGSVDPEDAHGHPYQKKPTGC